MLCSKTPLDARNKDSLMLLKVAGRNQTKSRNSSCPRSWRWILVTLAAGGLGVPPYCSCIYLIWLFSTFQFLPSIPFSPSAISVSFFPSHFCWPIVFALLDPKLASWPLQLLSTSRLLSTSALTTVLIFRNFLVQIPRKGLICWCQSGLSVFG